MDLLVVLVWLMAAGITQPGGGTNPILIEDDTDTSGGRAAGPYTFAQISTAFPALCIDLGTTPKSYRMTVSLVNGDGVGTATTTLQASSIFVTFDSTRSYSVSATGRANRWTEFGTRLNGTKPSGRDGVSIVFGGATNIGGNGKFYGSTLRTTAGAITLAPATTGLFYEVVNCILASVTNGINLGLSTGSLTLIYNVDVIGGTGSFGAIPNFSSDSAERVTIGLNAGATHHIRTGVVMNAKDVVCIGVPTIASIRYTGGTPMTLISPTWDQGVQIFDTVTSGTIEEWWPMGIMVLDGNVNPIEGLPVRLLDGVGATVISTTTNSQGTVSFGSGLTVNCVKVVTYDASGGVKHYNYQGPFELRVNADGTVNPNWTARRVTFNWPYSATWLTSDKQYTPHADVIQLGNPAGNPSNWVELSM